MHDARGAPLKKGDLVLIPARITELYETEDFCNVAMVSALGRRPDGLKETIGAINTGVVIRANDLPDIVGVAIKDPTAGDPATD